MRKFLCLLLLFCVSKAFCQQDKMFTQYANYPTSINPAYAGSRDVLQILSIVRKQWVGFKGAPTSFVLSANSPLRVSGLGAAFSIEADRLGLTKSTDISTDVSYKVKISRDINFNFGLKASMSNFSISFASAMKQDNTDLLLSQDIKGRFLVNMGFGLFMYSDKFFVGASIPRLLNYSISDGDVVKSSVRKNRRHMYFMGGYVFELSPMVKLKPSMLVKAVGGSRLSYDITSMAILNNVLCLGASFRNEESIAGIVQVYCNPQLRVGYSYDFSIGEFSAHTKGSHELSVSYDFDFKSVRIKNPRYF